MPSGIAAAYPADQQLFEPGGMLSDPEDQDLLPGLTNSSSDNEARAGAESDSSGDDMPFTARDVNRLTRILRQESQARNEERRTGENRRRGRDAQMLAGLNHRLPFMATNTHSQSAYHPLPKGRGCSG